MKGWGRWSQRVAAPAGWRFYPWLGTGLDAGRKRAGLESICPYDSYYVRVCMDRPDKVWAEAMKEGMSLALTRDWQRQRHRAPEISVCTMTVEHEGLSVLV